MDMETAASQLTQSGEPAAKKAKLQATAPPVESLYFRLSPLVIKSGAGSGKTKAVGFYDDQLFVEGLRNGDFSIPLADISMVFLAPTTVTSTRQKLNFLAIVLLEPLGKSDVVVFSFKEGEQATAEQGSLPLKFECDFGGPTPELLYRVLPTLTDCRKVTVRVSSENRTSGWMAPLACEFFSSFLTVPACTYKGPHPVPSKGE